MTEEKLKDFLHGYADVLRESRENWSPLRGFAPFHCFADMPGGRILIKDANCHVVASVRVSHTPDGEEFTNGCSMPVSGFDMALADLFVKVANLVLTAEMKDAA